jgi:hypothetical protein
LAIAPPRAATPTSVSIPAAFALRERKGGTGKGRKEGRKGGRKGGESGDVYIFI